jgi:hypothetical protein
VNLAPALFCYFLLCRGALLTTLRSALLHVGISSTTSLGSLPVPIFPRLGLLSLVFATYDPPLWRVRLLDARPSVTRLHARMRKKIRQLRRAIGACNQCCAAPRRTRFNALCFGTMLEPKNCAQRRDAAGLPLARFNATSPVRRAVNGPKRAACDPAPASKDRPAMRPPRFLLPDTPIQASSAAGSPGAAQ